jgi:hypothetical protein
VDPRALVPEPGNERGSRQRRHGADPAEPEPSEPRADIGVRRQQAGRPRREPRRLLTRRDDRRLAGARIAGGDRGREARPGNPGAGPAGQDRGGDGDQALDEARLGAPQPPEAVDLDLEQPERRIGRVARSGEPGAERRERLEGGLDGPRVRIRLRVEEAGLRRQPVRGPERDPAPDPERSGGSARVEDRPVRPRLSAEDDRTGRERAGARARARQVEQEMGP